MRTLERILIKGFKSIREQDLALGPLNVFIGGNGSGKSNLIESFRLLHEIVNQRLTTYAARKGGADNLLYFGRKATSQMHLYLRFGEGTVNDYYVGLQSTDDDELIVFLEEANSRGDWGNGGGFYSRAGESGLRQEKSIAAGEILKDLDSYRIYHFHDTSETAAVKGTCEVEDNRFLRPQAENLAAFLYWLQEKRPEHLAGIEGTLRQIAPFFDGFQLAPSRLNESRIRLEWRERGSDAYFNASAFSDGTLRFICLATLLLQPELPALVLLDEPELGLHPAAVVLLAELLSSASTRTQVIVATQSVTLINQLRPEDVWTVDREDGQSVFRHLAEADMSAWLDEYALGELWEKNLLGARP